MSLNLGNFKASVNDLRLPVTLEIKTATPDNAGGNHEAWAAWSGVPQPVWVRNQVERASYVGEGDQMIVIDLHNITMRWVQGVTGDGVFRFNSQWGIWFIKTAVDPLNNQHWLVCTCTEVAQ